MYLRGMGDFDLCRQSLQPFMNKTNETQTSLNGVYQPLIHFQNSEFYGFSEFYYCTEDVLRMGGDYNAAAFTKAAKVTFRETTVRAPRLGRLGRTVAGLALPSPLEAQVKRRERWRTEGSPATHIGDPVPSVRRGEWSSRSPHFSVS